jgi:hypothetical protein
MRTIRIMDYPKLDDLAWKFADSNDSHPLFNNGPLLFHEPFLHSLGYKSAAWIPGTFKYSLSEKEHSWFLLRWSCDHL